MLLCALTRSLYHQRALVRMSNLCGMGRLPGDPFPCHRAPMTDETLANLRATAAGRFWALVGIEFVSAEPGHVVCSVRLRDEHLNYNEVVHGGVISSLIDSAAGGAVRSTRSLEEIAARPHATSDLHVVYMAPARGSALVADARVVRKGRTAVFTEVDVTGDDGKLVARGLVTFVIGQGPPVRRD